MSLLNRPEESVVERKLVFSRLYVVYPAAVKCTLSFEDHSWVKRAPICTNRCQIVVHSL